MLTDAVFFDLDGTLTDSQPGIVASIRHALERLGHDAPSDTELATYIGPPLRRTFAKLLGSDDPELHERAVALYRERFGTVGLFENAVYDGVPEMLAALALPDRALFVATSKPTVYASRIIDHFNLRDHFRCVYGSELDGHNDVKAALLAHALDAEGIAAERAIMVGDRAADIIGAKANGMAAIGALWGYGTERELLDAGADHICADAASLGERITRLLDGRRG